MGLAGDRGRCVDYLMGKHTIAHKMYRYNPAVLLYAPAAYGQPSTCFGSFNTPQITKVGLELDHKLAALLDHLDVPAPAALTES